MLILCDFQGSYLDELTDEVGLGAYDISVKEGVNSINELTFSIPKINPKVSMLINNLYVIYNNETFELSGIKENNDNSSAPSFEVTCTHYADSLRKHIIVEQELNPADCPTQMEVVLVDTGWTVGTIQGVAKNRGFSFNRMTCFEALMEIAETYNIYLVFSSVWTNGVLINTVNGYDKSQEAINDTFFVNRSMTDIKIEKEAKDIVTRLYCFGGTNPSTGLDVDLLDAVVDKSALPALPDTINYQTHVQDIGWMGFVSDGEISGTTAKSSRVEAIQINLEGALGIEYRVHIQDFGWSNWAADNSICGTVGESKRLEAIEVRLYGAISTLYDVSYRVHVQDIGWMDWVSNGITAGTTGLSYRMEAIQIKVTPKGTAVWGKTYIENYDYYLDSGLTQSYIDNNIERFKKEDVFEDSNYVYSNDLYYDCVKKLAIMAYPVFSVSFTKMQFSGDSIPYLGEVVNVIDEDFNESYRCQIISISRSEDTPWIASFTVSNVIKYKSLFKTFAKASNKVKTTIGSSGKVRDYSIRDGSISNDKIKELAVTSDKIAHGAVTEEQLTDTIKTQISDAFTNAGLAVSTSNGAVTIAQGKNKIYYQTTEPTGTFVTNDTWFDTDNDNKAYNWSGTAWVARTFGTGAFTAESITTGLIAAGQVTTGKIAAGAITADSGILANLSVISGNIVSLVASKITTGKLQSVDTKTYFNLDSAEIKLDAGAAGTVLMNPTVGMQIKNQTGVQIGGTATVGGVLGTIAGAITNSPTADFYSTSGDSTIQGSSSKGLVGYLKSVSTTVPVFKLHATSQYSAFEKSSSNGVRLGADESTIYAGNSRLSLGNTGNCVLGSSSSQILFEDFRIKNLIDHGSGYKISGVDSIGRYNETGHFASIIDYTHVPDMITRDFGGKIITTPTTGCIIIDCGTDNFMFHGHIAIRSYNYMVDLDVGGYTRTANTDWYIPQATGKFWCSTSGIQGLNVRFIANGSQRYIVIGEATTVWGSYIGVTAKDFDITYGLESVQTPWSYSLETALPTGRVSSTQPIYNEKLVRAPADYIMWQVSQIVALTAVAQNVSQNISIAVPTGVFATKPDSVIVQCASTNGMVCSYKFDSSTATSLVIGVLKCDGAIGAGNYRFSIQAVKAI